MRSIKIFLLICGLSLITSSAVAQDFTQANTDRISIGTYTEDAGTPVPTPPYSNANSTNPRMSKNGRFVVFESTAGNLVAQSSINGHVVFPHTTITRSHIYLYDRQADSLELISVQRPINNTVSEISTHAHNPAVSNDGRYVTFTSAADIAEFQAYPCRGDGCHIHKFYDGVHVWVRDRLANETFLASQSSIPSKVQKIEEGAFVTKDVTACITPTVTPGCNIDNPEHVYTYKAPDMEIVTRRISAATFEQIMNTPTPATPESSNPRLTGDGRFVAFDSDAENLDEFKDADPLIPDPTPGVDYDPADGLLDDEFYVQPAIGAYADNNGVRDIFVRDGQGFTTKRVNLGCQYHAPGGCDVEGHADSTDPSISDDATIVAFATTWPFMSSDWNGVSDIYVIERDFMNGEVSYLDRISNDTGRIMAGNGASTRPALSGDGRFIAYQSDASNLVSGDTNEHTDIFIYDRNFFRTIRCTNSLEGDSTLPDISGSGEYVSFQSTATNLGAVSGTSNAYVAAVSRDSQGRLDTCAIVLASYGSGTGADDVCSNVSVGVVSSSSVDDDGNPTRIRKPAVAYQSDATNLTAATDGNVYTDIFQAPTCEDVSTDTDSDSTPDCFDQCWNDPLKVTDVDTDSDGIADCEDGCPADPQKTSLGQCGCGIVDNDTDSDGFLDCTEECDNDPNKTEGGICGCGQPDTDTDEDGTPDCEELDSNIPTPVPSVSATPTPDFTAVTPQAARLTKKSSSSIQVRLYNTGLNKPVARYVVRLQKKVGGSYVTKKTYTKTSNLFTLSSLGRYGSGRYRVTYKAVSTDNTSSQYSSASNIIRLP